jgi:hypothetical protein
MTPDQLRRLQQAIEDRYGFIAAQMQSEDYQPDPAQLQRWQRLGLVPEHVTPETFVLSVPPELHLLRNSFIMGRLAEAVERGESFDQVMALAVNMPLRKPDLAAIAMAEQHAGIYIRNFAGDVDTEAGKLWAKKQGEKVRDIIVDYHRQTLQARVLDQEAKEALGETIPEKIVSSWQQFASELHHVMDDKARDWARIAYYETNESEKQGNAHRILEEDPDALVYKVPLPTACAMCKFSYLLSDEKTPRLFKLSELMANGSNIGRKPHPTRGGKVVPGGRIDGEETVKPVVGLMHPWCACLGVYRAVGWESWLTDKQKEIIKAHNQKKGRH